MSQVSDFGDVVEVAVRRQQDCVVHDGVAGDEDVQRAGRTHQSGAPQRTLDVEHQRRVWRLFQRESERDLLAIVRVLLRRFGTVTELERLWRAGDEKIHRRTGQLVLETEIKQLTHTGDIDTTSDGQLTIRLDPLPTPRATAAAAELCEHLPPEPATPALTC